MPDHIAYAMRNAKATKALIYFNAPSALKDWSHLAIEWIVFVGFALALAHAVRHARKHRSPSALYTLLGCFLYGLLIDITSYYTVDSFWHGEFSVMFLYNRLPLYIALFYPAFMYHAFMSIRRLEFSPWLEAVSVGFLGGLMYMIFDNIGPLLGWWIWDRNAPSSQPFVNSVPLTSYQWFFLFTGTFAFFARMVCWDWVSRGKGRPWILAGLVLLPIVTCVVGVLLFVPYNLFARSGMFRGAALFHAASFTLAGLALLLNFRRPRQPRDTLLMLFPFLWIVGHLYIYIAKFDVLFTIGPNGLSADGLPAGNLIAAMMAIVASMALLLVMHPAEGRSSEGGERGSWPVNRKPEGRKDLGPAERVHHMVDTQPSSQPSNAPRATLDGTRCLVTGAAGFVGSHLVDALLARGCTVHAFDVVDEPRPRQAVTWFKGDVRHRGDLDRALVGVDAIFHTAAIIELSRSAPKGAAERVWGVNVEGTRTLLDCARSAGVHRFVHTSSMAVVFGQKTRGGDETVPYSTNPDLYSSTKAASERIVLEADGVSGLRTCALRPGGIYGPGERHFTIGPLVEAMSKGLPVIAFGRGQSLLDYTYIDNLVDAQLKAAERLALGSPVCGQAYFITDGQPISAAAFTMRLVEHMGLSARQLRIPRPIARSIGALLEFAFVVSGKPPVFTRTHVDMVSSDNYFSIEKAARDLDYRPTVNMNEGIRRTAREALDYYRSLRGASGAAPS